MPSVLPMLACSSESVSEILKLFFSVVGVIILLYIIFKLVNYKHLYLRANTLTGKISLAIIYFLPLLLLFYPTSWDWNNYWFFFLLKLYLVTLYYVAIGLGSFIDSKLRKHFDRTKN